MWHPPVPSAKLYSPEALQLGSGLALLLWCYDNIQRDGSVEINLQRVAADIGKPYGTIREWWRALQSSSILASATDRGKRGWLVVLDSEWIDWRVMRHNYPDPQPQSTSNQRRDSDVENDERSVNAASTQNERRNLDVDPIYKEDHLDQDSLGDDATRKRAAASGGKKKTRAKTETEPGYQDMFEAIATVCKLDLKLCTSAQRLQASSAAKKLLGAQKQAEHVIKFGEWWAKHDWRGKRGEPPRPSQILDSWQQWEQKNATKPAIRVDLAQGDEWQGCRPAPLDQPF